MHVHVSMAQQFNTFPVYFHWVFIVMLLLLIFRCIFVRHMLFFLSFQICNVFLLWFHFVVKFTGNQILRAMMLLGCLVTCTICVWMTNQWLLYLRINTKTRNSQSFACTIVLSMSKNYSQNVTMNSQKTQNRQSQLRFYTCFSIKLCTHNNGFVLFFWWMKWGKGNRLMSWLIINLTHILCGDFTDS